MNYIKSSKKKNVNLLKKLKSLGLGATAIALIGLTSCETTSAPSVGNLNIYQPSTLRLQKGVKIKTIDGVYTPQTTEIWHSDTRFRKLEREIYYYTK